MEHLFLKYSTKDNLRFLLNALGKSFWVGGYLYEQMEIHPAVNSLAAFSFILTKVGIENMGANVDFNTLKDEIQKPALVHLNVQNGAFAVVKKIDSEFVSIATYGRDKKISITEFKTLFTGNILIVDNSPGKLRIERKDFISWSISKLSTMILPILFIVCLMTKEENATGQIYSLLHVIGLTLSLLLFARQMGYSNKITDSICSGGSKKANCNSVLNSAGGSLFGIITWSEIGLIYFFTLLVGKLILGYEDISFILAFIATISLPYVFYSLFYQWRVVKSWCPLCLGVQFVLLAQFVVAIVLWDGTIDSIVSNILILMLIGLIVTSILFSVKPLLEKSIRFKYTRITLNKLKHSEQVKSAFFETTPMNTDMITKITFFPEEKNIISFVFSPVCGHCIKKIESLIEIVENYDEVGIEFIFCNIDYTTHADANISKYLVEKYIESPDDFIKSLKEYAKRYPQSRNELENYQSTSSTSAQAEAIINSHNYWCHMNKITGTPAIFLNNRKLSEYYDLDDIIYMIH